MLLPLTMGRKGRGLVESTFVACLAILIHDTMYAALFHRFAIVNMLRIKLAILLEKYLDKQ